MSYKRLKLKLRVSLAGHIVAMATYSATKLTATCSGMIGQFVDSMILASTDKGVVIMTHQTVSLGKFWKLFLTTLRTNLSFFELEILKGGIGVMVQILQTGNADLVILKRFDNIHFHFADGKEMYQEFLTQIYNHSTAG